MTGYAVVSLTFKPLSIVYFHSNQVGWWEWEIYRFFELKRQHEGLKMEMEKQQKVMDDIKGECVLQLDHAKRNQRKTKNPLEINSLKPQTKYFR